MMQDGSTTIIVDPRYVERLARVCGHAQNDEPIADANLASTWENEMASIPGGLR